MKELLSKSDFIILKLIEYLLENPFSTFNDISQNLNISKRTLHTYFNEVNLKYFPISIDSEKNFATLVIPSNYSLSYIYSVTLQNSTEFNLLSYCFFEREVSYKHAEENLFISNATLKRKINRVNLCLTKYGFKIDSRTLRITGNEFSIINFFTNYIYEAYPINEKGFKKTEYSLIRQAIKAYSKIQRIEIDSYDLDKSTVIILIYLYRNKFNMKSFDTSESINLLTSNGIIDKKIKQTFFKKNSKFTIFSMLKKLQKQTIFSDYSHFISETKQNSELNNAKNIFNKLINTVSSNFSIEIPKNKEKILLDLCIVFNLQYGKPFIFYDKHSQFINQMKLIVPELIYLLEDELIFQFPKIQKYELNSYIYIFITHWIGLTTVLEEKKQKLKILLMFDTDVEHVSMLQHDIYIRLYKNCIIEVKPLYDFNNGIHHSINYDLVLTNIPAIEIKSTKVICFSMYPSKMDWIEINELYYKRIIKE